MSPLCRDWPLRIKFLYDWMARVNLEMMTTNSIQSNIKKHWDRLELSTLELLFTTETWSLIKAWEAVGVKLTTNPAIFQEIFILQREGEVLIFVTFNTIINHILLKILLKLLKFFKNYEDFLLQKQLFSSFLFFYFLRFPCYKDTNKVNI